MCLIASRRTQPIIRALNTAQARYESLKWSYHSVPSLSLTHIHRVPIWLNLLSRVRPPRPCKQAPAGDLITSV